MVPTDKDINQSLATIIGLTVEWDAVLPGFWLIGEGVTKVWDPLNSEDQMLSIEERLKNDPRFNVTEIITHKKFMVYFEFFCEHEWLEIIGQDVDRSRAIGLAAYSVMIYLRNSYKDVSKQPMPS